MRTFSNLDQWGTLQHVTGEIRHITNHGIAKPRSYIDPGGGYYCSKKKKSGLTIRRGIGRLVYVQEKPPLQLHNILVENNNGSDLAIGTRPCGTTLPPPALPPRSGDA